MRRCVVQAPGDNWVASMEPSDVQVKVGISSKTVGRQWKNIPVNAVVETGHSLVVEVDPPSVDVSITGRLSASESADKLQIRAFADCVGLGTPGVYTVPVRVHIAGDAKAVASPDAVKVTIRMPGDKGL